MRSFLLFLLGLSAGAAAVVTANRFNEAAGLVASPRAGRIGVSKEEAGGLPDALAAETNQPLAAGQEVRVLQRQLAARDREIARLKGTNTPPAESATNTVRRSWLEELKAADPDRYREIIERREQGREATRYQIARRAAHFLGKDRTSLGDEERKQRELMLSLLEESLTLTEKIRSDMPEEERRTLGRMLRDNMRELSPLLDEERERELMQLGMAIGYGEQDAADFVLYVNEIMELTSVRSIFRDSMRQMNGWDWRERGDEARGDGPERPAR